MWEVFTGGKTGYAQNKQKMIDFDDELEWDHGEGSGNPLQYSCLEYPMDKAAWWAVVHGVAKSWTWLSDQTHTRRMRPRAEAMCWHISDIFLLVSFHNVLAQQDETTFFLPSFSPSIFFSLSSPSQTAPPVPDLFHMPPDCLPNKRGTQDIQVCATGHLRNKVCSCTWYNSLNWSVKSLFFSPWWFPF